MEKGTKYSQQFKEDAVQYRLDHPELPLRKASENLGVSESALKNWMKAARMRYSIAWIIRSFHFARLLRILESANLH